MSDHDVLSIMSTINLYGLAVDTQRWDLFDRIFSADVDADFGTSRWRDLPTFKRDFAAFHDPFSSTQHVMMNHLVNVDGDVAQSFTYGSWRLIRKGIEGRDFWEGTGWYDDVWLRAQGRWLIERRTCRIVWWDGNPLAQETIPGIRFKLESSVLRREGGAGRVGFLNVIGRLPG